MRSGEGEAGRAVIEGSGCPVRCRVALITGLRDASLCVIRIVGVLEIGQMAIHANRVRAGQVVVVVDVALRTLDGGVRTGQREAGGRVIKRGVQPACGRMALLTGGRESGLDVVRVGCAIEIFHVARGTIGRCAHELTVDVALRASHIHVRAG